MSERLTEEDLRRMEASLARFRQTGRGDYRRGAIEEALAAEVRASWADRDAAYARGLQGRAQGLREGLLESRLWEEIERLMRTAAVVESTRDGKCALLSFADAIREGPLKKAAETAAEEGP